jgi:hypothetical protein
MSLQVTVNLTTSYQRVVTLVEAALVGTGIALLKTCFSRVRYMYPDTGAAGIITGTRNQALAGYVFKLDAPDISEDRISQKEMYTETITDMYVKSTTDGDDLIIEMDD